MGKFSTYIGSQFGNPRGIIGKICCLAMNQMNKKMYQAIVANLKEEQRILDIGYGNGFLIKKIYQKTSAKIDGIDISNDMKIIATKRNKDGVKNGDIHLTLGDCCDLQFKEKSFDAVTTVNTIYFWSDTLQGLKEIRRVLKEDGVFYNAVYTKDWMMRTSYTKEGFKLFEKEAYIQIAKQAGFQEVTITDIVAGRNFLIKCRK